MKDLLAREAKKAAFSIFDFQKRSRHFSSVRCFQTVLFNQLPVMVLTFGVINKTKRTKKVQIAFYKQYVVYG